MGFIEGVYNSVNNTETRPSYEPLSLEDSMHESVESDFDFDDQDVNASDSLEFQPRRRRPANIILGKAQDVMIAIKDWSKGPRTPRPWSIKPLFPRIQEAPIKFLDKHFPRQRHWLLVLLYAVWFLCFYVVLQKSAYAPDVPDYGTPVRIDCGQTFWATKNLCGLNGNDCRPFSNHTLTFRCPGNCLQMWLIEPRTVGDEEVLYKPLVVGGAPEDEKDGVAGGIYRADSFICGAAIHAGAISNIEGGSAVLELVGQHAGYPSTDRNGIESVGFNSSFPRSFRFVPGATSECRDLRWPLLFITATCTAILSVFTTSPGVFFFSNFIALFLHVSFVSDPPDMNSYYSVISITLGRLLPSTFIMYVIYHFVVRRTLLNLRAQFEKTILWMGGCWIGALNNETFDQWIPVQRLTPHDIAQQPGAIPALLITVGAILAIALGQAWSFRVEGRMRRYLVVYGIFVGGLLVLMTIPNMNLRIHHYIIGILLLPGTSMQTRPSLLYQGLLVGLFINGVARWGYASILSTPADLLRDAQLGSALPEILAPQILAGVGSMMSNITFSWTWPPPTQELGDENRYDSGATELSQWYDGISILVNDVERFRSYPDSEDSMREPEEEVEQPHFTWTRNPRDLQHPEYFRFAYMRGGMAQDYTKAGIWGADGGWTQMLPGPSR